MKFLFIYGKDTDEAARPIIIEELKKKFDSVLTVPLEKIRIDLENGKSKVSYKNQELSAFDGCTLRTLANQSLFVETVLSVLQENEVYLPSPPEALHIVNHKYFNVKVLSDNGIAVPATTLCVSPDSALRLTHKIGFPVVVKLLSGLAGMGVMLLNSEKEFRPVLETLQVFKEFISTQEYIPSDGSDIRCYIFGGDDILGVKRQAQKGEWRANVSRGGIAIPIEPSKELKEISLKSAKALGFEMCAVDYMMTPKGPMIVEMNFTPGIMVKYFKDKIGKRLVAGFYRGTLNHLKNKKK